LTGPPNKMLEISLGSFTSPSAGHNPLNSLRTDSYLSASYLFFR
jgi:hypothetical protein